MSCSKRGLVIITWRNTSPRWSQSHILLLIALFLLLGAAVLKPALTGKIVGATLEQSTEAVPSGVTIQPIDRDALIDESEQLAAIEMPSVLPESESTQPVDLPVDEQPEQFVGPSVEPGAGIQAQPLSAQNCTPAPADLVSFWTADDNPALRFVDDLQGNNTGNLTGGATLSPDGIVGQAFSLDGVTDFVNLTKETNLKPTTQLTVMFWFMPNASLTTNEGLVHGPLVSTGVGGWFMLGVTGGKIEAFIDKTGGGSYGRIKSSHPLNTGQWYHIAMTWNSSNLSIYLNGSFDNGTGGVTTIGYGTTAIWAEIGRYSTFGNAAGLFDEVMFFNRSLSAAEIQAVYNANNSGVCRICGQVSLNKTLTRNASGADTCFSIVRNDTTLNCNGFGIYGIGNGAAIELNGTSNAKIVNCPIANYSTGIALRGNASAYISDVSFVQTNTSILVVDSFSTNVSNTNFTPRAVFVDGEGNSINFTGSINISANISLKDLLNISFNRVHVNTSRVPGANASAMVQFNGLAFSAVRIETDEADTGSFSTCASPTCLQLSYNGSTTLFNVSRFTTYRAAQASNVSSITANTTLAQNASCPVDCFIFARNDTTLDCNGFGVYGSGGGIAIGSNSTVNNKVINCPIVNFSTGVLLNNSFGYYMQGLRFTATNTSLLVIDGFGNNISATNATPNAVFIESATGTVNFTSGINFTSNISFKDVINVSFNRTVVNTSRYPTINGSATIILKGISVAVPSILIRELDDQPFSACPASTCTIRDYTGSTIIFDVTRFTSYAVAESANTTTIVSNTTLTQNASCTGTCFAFGRNDTTLNCDGFGLYGRGSGTGIELSAVFNNKIINCPIINFSIGLALRNSSANYIQDARFLLTNTSLFVQNRFDNNISSTNATPTAIFQDDALGIINFTSPINFSINISLKHVINVSFGKAVVNSSRYPGLNSTATIVFNRLPLANAKMKIDELDTGLHVDCPSTTCTNTSYNGSTFIFNVTRFTTYSVTDSFRDEFTRADNTTVGNGWLEVDEVKGNLSIQGSRVAITYPGLLGPYQNAIGPSDKKPWMVRQVGSIAGAAVMNMTYTASANGRMAVYMLFCTHNTTLSSIGSKTLYINGPTGAMCIGGSVGRTDASYGTFYFSAGQFTPAPGFSGSFTPGAGFNGTSTTFSGVGGPNYDIVARLGADKSINFSVNGFSAAFGASNPSTPLDNVVIADIGMVSYGGGCNPCISYFDDFEFNAVLNASSGNCADGVQNGLETGVDCGGLVCAPCPDGQGCSANSDCISRNCTSGICGGVTLGNNCTNGIRDDLETDIDCGGGMCGDCNTGFNCSVNTDCFQNFCEAGVCQTPCVNLTSPGYLANLSTTFCPGRFNVTDAAGGAVIANANYTFLICQGTYIAGNDKGIGFNVTGRRNVDVIGCTITDYNTSILYEYTNRSRAVNVSLNSTTVYGIAAAYSDNLLIANSSVFRGANSSASGRAAIFVLNSTNASITGTLVANSSYVGIWLDGSRNAAIEGSTIAENSNIDVYIRLSPFAFIRNNTFSHRGLEATLYWSFTSNGTTVVNNTFLHGCCGGSFDASLAGASGMDNVVLTGNSFYDTVGNVIGGLTTAVVDTVNNWTIADNIIVNASGYAIGKQIGARILRNVINNTNTAIRLMSSSHTLVGNNISNASIALQLGGFSASNLPSNDDIIANNTIQASHTGILLQFRSQNNTFTGNIINTTGPGLVMSRGAAGNEFGQTNTGAEQQNFTLDNLFNGRPILWLNGSQNLVINTSINPRYVGCNYCDNVKIENLSFDSLGGGIHLTYSKVTISGLNITGPPDMNVFADGTQTDNSTIQMLEPKNGTLIANNTISGAAVFPVSSSGYKLQMNITGNVFNRSAALLLRRIAGMVVQNNLFSNESRVTFEGPVDTVVTQNRFNLGSYIHGTNVCDSAACSSSSGGSNVNITFNNFSATTVTEELQTRMESGIIFSGNRITNATSVALWLYGVISGAIISYNTLANGTSDGIALDTAGTANGAGNVIIGNNISGMAAAAIHLEGASDNVSDNIISLNKIGIQLGSTSGVSPAAASMRIYNNNITDNTGAGILVIAGTGSHNITRNIIARNIGCGINMSAGTGSIIYDNLFNNTCNANATTINFWNTTYQCGALGTSVAGGNCTGGNFWSNYAGVDDGSGAAFPYNIANDFIGDTFIPYNNSNSINTSNISGDYLPLIAPVLAPTCVNPADDYFVNVSTTFCSGTFNITDAGAGGVIIANANNIEILCQDTKITANDLGIGFNVTGKTNVTIRNCLVENYNESIRYESASAGAIINVTVNSSRVFGIRLELVSQSVVVNTRILQSTNDSILVRNGTAVNITSTNISRTTNDAVHIINSSGVLLYGSTLSD
ncbi:right-handed parallel beta-helix repeat-containing protein, partial [Candidatus Woesearchaeota archaeon]|nr:right-handed parallel beta-helix repeat-containing protein [Candidatus Woesearchaeota archaeon]